MKKSIFTFFVLSILTLTVSTSTHAQDKNSDIKHLLEAMNSEQISQSILNSMVPILKQQITSQIKGNNTKKSTDKMMETMMNTMMEEMEVLMNKLNNEELVNIYDKHFTHEEIKDLISFYESSTGKKLLEKTPEITADLTTVLVTKYMPEIQENLNKKLEEFK